MSAFLADIDRFVALATAPKGSLQSLQEASNQTYQHINGAPKSEIDEGLRRLAEVLRTCHPMVAGIVAINCGGLVENGADPEISVGPLGERLPGVLKNMLGCLERAIEIHAEQEDDTENEDDEVQPEELVQRYGEQIFEEDQELAIGYDSYHPMYLSAVAHMSFSKRLRQSFPHKAELLDLSNQVDQFLGGSRSFLTKMLLVLDDEPIIVIDPAQRKGYRLTIGGVADNFQLHVLLASQLIGSPKKGLLDYPKQTKSAIDAALGVDDSVSEPVTGSFFMWNWFTIADDGASIGEPASGPVGVEERIWNEGVPADIEPLDGERVVLLGPSLYSSSWSAGRVFGNLPASVTVNASLSDEEVSSWIDRMVQAKKKRST